jgi:hypothetical protein
MPRPGRPQNDELRLSVEHLFGANFGITIKRTATIGELKARISQITGSKVPLLTIGAKEISRDDLRLNQLHITQNGTVIQITGEKGAILSNQSSKILMDQMFRLSFSFQLCNGRLILFDCFLWD